MAGRPVHSHIGVTDILIKSFPNFYIDLPCSIEKMAVLENIAVARKLDFLAKLHLSIKKELYWMNLKIDSTFN